MVGVVAASHGRSFWLKLSRVDGWRYAGGGEEEKSSREVRNERDVVHVASHSHVFKALERDETGRASHPTAEPVAMCDVTFNAVDYQRQVRQQSANMGREMARFYLSSPPETSQKKKRLKKSSKIGLLSPLGRQPVIPTPLSKEEETDLPMSARAKEHAMPADHDDRWSTPVHAWDGYSDPRTGQQIIRLLLKCVTLYRTLLSPPSHRIPPPHRPRLATLSYRGAL